MTAINCRFHESSATLVDAAGDPVQGQGPVPVFDYRVDAKQRLQGEGGTLATNDRIRAEILGQLFVYYYVGTHGAASV